MDILAARDRAVIQFLTDHIGKPTPLNREIAAHLGVSQGTAEASLYRVFKSGRAHFVGTSSFRTIIVHGVGATVPRQVKALVEPAPVEPVRVLDSFPCIRCGTARGCGCYTARLTSAARLPSHVGA